MKTRVRNISDTIDAPRWAELIKQKRKELRENQTIFGARFGVSYAAVSQWELGEANPPGEVTWWLVQEGMVDDARK